MLSGNRRVALIVLVVSLVTGSMMTGIAQGCYEDLIVTGSGRPLCNGTYYYIWHINDKPSYVLEDETGRFVAWVTWYNDGCWRLSDGWNVGVETYAYVNCQDTPTPPSSGWLVQVGPAPTPTMSGGEALDTTPPVLTLPPDVTIYSCDSIDPVNTGYATAVDAIDPDPEITYIDSNWHGGGFQGLLRKDRTWTAEDACGNVIMGVQVITWVHATISITDVSVAWITSLPQSVTISYIASSAPCVSLGQLHVRSPSESYWSPQASVVCNGSTVNSATTLLPIDATEGLYDISFHYVDTVLNCWAYSILTPTVFGVDLTAPAIHDMPADIEILTKPGESCAVVHWVLPTATDETSGIATFTSTHHSGDTLPVGATTITYTATDRAGHVTTATFDVTVVGVPAEVFPAGSGILDSPLPLEEGEEPPMMGELPLAGLFTVGDAILGSCHLLNAEGHPITGIYLGVYVYAVDIAARPEVRTLVDHWRVVCDRVTGEYRFECLTEGLEPGIYDIYLSFDGTLSETLRVELVPPEV